MKIYIALKLFIYFYVFLEYCKNIWIRYYTVGKSRIRCAHRAVLGERCSPYISVGASGTLSESLGNSRIIQDIVGIYRWQ
jgi:hypothetical protein